MTIDQIPTSQSPMLCGAVALEKNRKNVVATSLSTPNSPASTRVTTTRGRRPVAGGASGPSGASGASGAKVTGTPGDGIGECGRNARDPERPFHRPEGGFRAQP